MKVHKPYQYKTGYIYLPLQPEIEGLEPNLVLFGDEYHLKSSFHVSLVCVKNILAICPDRETQIIGIFSDFIKTTPLTTISYLPEYRIASHSDGRKSIIQMVTIDNLELLFKKIRTELSIEIDTQPTHITIYTLQKDKGIGITSQEDYKNTFEIRIQ